MSNTELNLSMDHTGKLPQSDIVLDESRGQDPRHEDQRQLPQAAEIAQGELATEPEQQTSTTLASSKNSENANTTINAPLDPNVASGLLGNGAVHMQSGFGMMNMAPSMGGHTMLHFYNPAMNMQQQTQHFQSMQGMPGGQHLQNMSHMPGMNAGHPMYMQSMYKAPTGKDYTLILRQQPKHSRMCGYGDKVDRRPIDPPPIIQVIVREHGREANNHLYNPYFFMYATLSAPQGDEELHVLKDGRTRATSGTTISSLYRLKDVDQSDAAFFVFPDLSVRIEGSYRIKFSLFEIEGGQVHHRRSIYSNIFTVYSAKKFPGMEESTYLSRSFAEQGLRLRIRKEVRQSRKKRYESNRNSSDDEAPPAAVNRYATSGGLPSNTMGGYSLPPGVHPSAVAGPYGQSMGHPDPNMMYGGNMAYPQMYPPPYMFGNPYMRYPMYDPNFHNYGSQMIPFSGEHTGMSMDNSPPTGTPQVPQVKKEANHSTDANVTSQATTTSTHASEPL